MDFALSDEQQELGRTVRAFLEQVHYIRYFALSVEYAKTLKAKPTKR